MGISRKRLARTDLSVEMKVYFELACFKVMRALTALVASVVRPKTVKPKRKSVPPAPISALNAGCGPPALLGRIFSLKTAHT